MTDIHAIGRRYLDGEGLKPLAAEVQLTASALHSRLKRAGYVLNAEQRTARQHHVRNDGNGIFAMLLSDEAYERQRQSDFDAGESAWSARLAGLSFDSVAVGPMVGRIALPETYVAAGDGAGSVGRRVGVRPV